MNGLSADSSDPNAVNMYRFFDTGSGTHFYTASASEANAIEATRPDMVAEGASFKEYTTQEVGTAPVYRFFDSSNGTHFFTSNAGEQASLAATRPDMAYEGIAFYAPTTS